jgi:hypothetical protein
LTVSLPFLYSGKHWWHFDPQDGNPWSQLGQGNPCWSQLIVENGHPVTTGADLAAEVLRWYPALSRAKTGYMIHNPRLRAMFDIKGENLLGNLTARKDIFLKNDWEAKSDAPLRKIFVDQLKTLGRKQLPWQNGLNVKNFCCLSHPYCFPLVLIPFYCWQDRVDVYPMLQGTREDAVWNVCKNGFATVAKVDDGYYGKGMYFSSDLDYVLNMPRRPQARENLCWSPWSSLVTHFR